MYHPILIKKKQDVTLPCMAAKNKKQLGLLDEATYILEYNTHIEPTIINNVRQRIDCEGLA